MVVRLCPQKAVGGEPFAGGRDKQAAIVATAARAAPIARRQLRFPVPIIRILLVLLTLASPLSMAGGAVAGPFEDAQAAHSRRDYATALRLWRPLADQGNAEAQYALGFMYDGGQGVPKNYAGAAKMVAPRSRS